MVKIKSLKDWLLRFGLRARIGLQECDGGVHYFQGPDRAISTIELKPGEQVVLIVNDCPYIIRRDRRGHIEAEHVGQGPAGPRRG
jgi:hypothetical protein